MEPYFQVSLHTQLSYKLSEFPERLMFDTMGLELLVQEKKKRLPEKNFLGGKHLSCC